ncbi:MAG: hypothetical protein WCG05_05405 [Alphaproteobacteria bacterium]
MKKLYLIICSIVLIFSSDMCMGKSFKCKLWPAALKCKTLKGMEEYDSKGCITDRSRSKCLYTFLKNNCVPKKGVCPTGGLLETCGKIRRDLSFTSQESSLVSMAVLECVNPPKSPRPASVVEPEAQAVNAPVRVRPVPAPRPKSFTEGMSLSAPTPRPRPKSSAPSVSPAPRVVPEKTTIIDEDAKTKAAIKIQRAYKRYVARKKAATASIDFLPAPAAPAKPDLTSAGLVPPPPRSSDEMWTSYQNAGGTVPRPELSGSAKPAQPVSQTFTIPPVPKKTYEQSEAERAQATPGKKDPVPAHTVKNNPSTPPKNGANPDLLEQIRVGRKLKHVSQVRAPSKSKNPLLNNEAFIKRAQANSDEDEQDTDEWDE